MNNININYFTKSKKIICDNYKYFLIFTIISLVSYLMYIFPHLASDSYCQLTSLDASSSSGAILNGRPLAWVLIAFMKALNLNYVGNPIIQIFTNLIAVISHAIAATIIFSQLRQKTILSFICVASIFTNVFFADILQFIELSPQFQFSLIYAALAAVIVNKSTIPIIPRLALSAILIILVASSYQIYLAYFIIFSVILYIQNLSDENFDKVKTFWSIAAIYVVGCVFTLVYFNVFLPGQSRISFSEIPIADNIRGIFLLFIGILRDGSGILPYFSVAAIFAIGFAAMLRTMVSNYKTVQLMPLVGIAGMLISTFLHCITAAPAQFCVSQRSTVACLAIPFAMILISLNKPKINFRSVQDVFLTVIVSAFLLINIVSTNILGIGLQKVNFNDKEELKYISSTISDYEKENNCTVTKIGFAYDKDVVKYYDGILASYDINTRALSCEWTIVPGISYFLGHELSPVEFDEEKSGISLNENYDDFTDSNIKFVDDTVYVVIY